MVDKDEGIESAGLERESDATHVASTPKTPKDAKNAIIEALMELAGERAWEDITISDVATRANVSLSTFRDLFPSKGAILASFSRNIDKIVLEVDRRRSHWRTSQRAFVRRVDAPSRRVDAL